MEVGRRGRYTGREVAQSGSRAGGCRYRCLELCSARVAMAERAPDPRASPWSNAYHADYYGTPRDVQAPSREIVAIDRIDRNAPHAGARVDVVRSWRVACAKPPSHSSLRPPVF